jgi:UDP-GlcNAc:undecaprenyl-phosphate GlcNAc-1-phosphate transferase
MILLAWLGAVFLLGICASLLITPIVISGAGALRLYDAPDGARRMHVAPVPRLGGIAVYLATSIVSTSIFFVGASVFSRSDALSSSDGQTLLGIFLGTAILFLVGLLDDVRGLAPGTKFLAQITAALVAYGFGIRIESVTLGYGVGVHVGMLGAPLLMLWIVGVTNAYNFIDGLNGLAGGIALVACAAIVIAGLALGNIAVLVPAMALAGATFGFLHYNFPKARVFLGDSGSMSVGFLLAILLLKAAEVPGPSVLVAIPILAMFVPLLDAALAIVRRWLRDVPLSGADARHIHHRLLALGLAPERTAIVLWCLALVMASFGLLIALTAPFVATSIAILGLVGLSVLVIYGTNLLSYHELIVAGEVLMSAPSRARRLISDQILALDVNARIANAHGFDEAGAILASTASRFGFLRMELIGEHSLPGSQDDHSAPWAWKLEYPLRSGIGDGASPLYRLAIWCSSEYGVRPYGAERAARIIAPALEQWLVARSNNGATALAVGAHERDVRPRFGPASRGRPARRL